MLELSVLDACRDPDAGGVDEQVEAAGALDVLADDPLAVLGLRDVGGDRGRAELGGGSSTFSAVREASVSSNPSSLSIRAIASPMPEDPPVISADRTSLDYLRNAQGVVDGMPNLAADTQAPPLP